MAEEYTNTFLSYNRQRLWTLYAAETANAVAALLLIVGLSFYTHHRFGREMRENFTLAVFQGVSYTLGALPA